MSLIYLLPLTFVVYYFVFKFCILKFDLKTPGRGDDNDEIKLMSKKEYNAIKEAEAEGKNAADLWRFVSSKLWAVPIISKRLPAVRAVCA